MTSADNKTITIGTRLAAMLLDHVFMTVIVMIFFVPGMISNFSDAVKVSHEPTDFNPMGGPMMYMTLFGFALYFCKDIINGRSLAKRILKLQIVDNKTGQVATPLQSLVRNIFCIIWIIEVIVAMTNTSRRLGDRVAGTKLIPYNPTLEQPGLTIGKILLPILISYGVSVLLFQLIPSIPSTRSDYSRSSYNQGESKKLERLITDSLGQYLVPEIRVYDTMYNSRLKYVSAILTLKENYIDDDDSFRQLQDMTTTLIYQQFPRETLQGQAKYVYRASGQFRSRTVIIGTLE